MYKQLSQDIQPFCEEAERRVGAFLDISESLYPVQVHAERAQGTWKKGVCGLGWGHVGTWRRGRGVVGTKKGSWQSALVRGGN